MLKDTIFDLTGRKALVTGGSRGIGQAIATIFSQAGAEVMISSRHEKDLQKTARMIAESAGGRVEYCVADMACRKEVVLLAETAQKVLGQVDILVNNAGGGIPQRIDQVEDTVWDQYLEVNLTSCMVLTRALTPGMKQRQWGRVIHISSIMAFASAGGRNTYSATKAALVGMTRASALELGTYGVTVNCIAPGPVATELPLTRLTKEQQEVFTQRTALNRWGQPEEITGPALLLASEAGSFITGSALVVDGGVLARIF